jgi:hypothetical protein
MRRDGDEPFLLAMTMTPGSIVSSHRPQPMDMNPMNYQRKSEPFGFAL